MALVIYSIKKTKNNLCEYNENYQSFGDYSILNTPSKYIIEFMRINKSYKYQYYFTYSFTNLKSGKNLN